LIVKIRKYIPEKLTYAANWDDFDKVPFWRNLITLNRCLFSAIWCRNLWKSSIKLWSSTLQNGQTTSQNKKNTFTEFGYRNLKLKEPWTESQNTMNNLAQANAMNPYFKP
jgi:hypothetical protein